MIPVRALIGVGPVEWAPSQYGSSGYYHGWLSDLSATTTSTLPPINLSKLIKSDPFHPRKRNYLIWLWLTRILDMSLHFLFTVPQPVPRFKGLIYQHEIQYNIAMKQDPPYGKWGVLFLPHTIPFRSCQPDRVLEWPLESTAEAWRWQPVTWCYVPNR